MLKREWGVESDGKLLHDLSIPSKTAAWIPEFAVEDLPLSRTAVMVPEFKVKDLPLGRLLKMGGRVIGISGSLIWSKTLMELIFNPCGEFR